MAVWIPLESDHSISSDAWQYGYGLNQTTPRSVQMLDCMDMVRMRPLNQFRCMAVWIPLESDHSISSDARLYGYGLNQTTPRSVQMLDCMDMVRMRPLNQFRCMAVWIWLESDHSSISSDA
ncbi:hypothetical protein ACJMK2_033698 [Sinanodonta woodiana]|uniref:Uncharacterized protein n=1 Tax=Sinanodonta woodiana TaxID=1069815 RepID=A0ABD3WP61_SINWO